MLFMTTKVGAMLNIPEVMIRENEGYCQPATKFSRIGKQWRSEVVTSGQYD